MHEVLWALVYVSSLNVIHLGIDSLCCNCGHASACEPPTQPSNKHLHAWGQPSGGSVSCNNGHLGNCCRGCMALC
jgi:hypothetical protein